MLPKVMEQGVTQGSPLSPIVAIITLDYLKVTGYGVTTYAYNGIVTDPRGLANAHGIPISKIIDYSPPRK